MRDPQYLLRKYKIFLKKEEYHRNNSGKIHAVLMLWNLRKKNRIGNMLGILIPSNAFNKGLIIMHHGEVIVNPNARICEYCILHGEIA